MRSGWPCSTRPAARSLRESLSRSLRKAAVARLFDRSPAGLPPLLCQPDAVAAADANQVELIEFRRQCLGLLLLYSEPRCYRRDRGPAQDLAARLLEERLAEAAGTAGGYGVLTSCHSG